MDKRQDTSLRTSKQMIQALSAISTVLALTACGGGGSGSNETLAPNTTTTYPLRAAYQNLISQNEVTTFSISGTCSGSATETRGAAVPASFEGLPGVSTTLILSGNYSNCTPASFAQTTLSYYDTNYKLIGSVNTGSDYAIYNVGDLPLSVKVGDAAQFGTADVYASSSKQVKTGTRTLSYVVESDSGNTAIINLIAKGYNAYGQPLYTQQSRYRIDSIGRLTAISIDIQYSTTSTARMLWTKN